MSILNGPRINFFGGIEVDVSLPNNLDEYYIDSNGDPVPAEKQKEATPNAIFDSKTSTLTDFIYDNNITDEQIITMLRGPTDNNGVPYFTNGGWNIYGQHSVVTNNVNVSSGGNPGAVTESSPFTGQPIYILGSANPDTGQTGVSSPVMVDLNPIGSQYSQIVLGGLLIGDSKKPLLHLQGDRICSNTLCGKPSGLGLDQKILQGAPDSPGSSMFTGTWQVTFTKEEIIASGQSADTAANTAIEAFIATPGFEGIVIDFTFFEMCPKYGTENVRQSYNTNEDERNPSVGRIVGTIGIAYSGDTAQCPDGRVLLANVSTDSGGEKGDNNFYATSYASAFSTSPTEAVLAVNMLTTLTQKSFRTNRDDYTSSTIDAAINVGSLAVTAGGSSVGSLTPDYTDYYKYGGIVDLSISSSTLTTVQGGILAIESAPGASTIKSLNLAEQAYRIYSNDKDLYMGENSSDTHTVNLQVRYLGQPITQGVELSVKQVDLDDLNKESYLDLSVTSISLAEGQLSASYTLQNSTGAAAEAGYEQVQFSYDSASYTVNTRKYMYTDFGLAKGAAVTWDDVYKHALRFHYLNFLGMSTVFPLNMAQTIQQHKEGIKLRTSSKYWPTSLYMPIVRSMSPSQVRLINAYSFGTPWDPDAKI